MWARVHRRFGKISPPACDPPVPLLPNPRRHRFAAPCALTPVDCFAQSPPPSPRLPADDASIGRRRFATPERRLTSPPLRAYPQSWTEPTHTHYSLSPSPNTQPRLHSPLLLFRTEEQSRATIAVLRP